MSSSIPEKIGKYEIQKQVGRGSMGVVYQSYDPFIEKDVAIKVALVESLRDKESGEQYREIFFNEAHSADLLKHPNVVEIIDAGAEDEDCYIVMELVENGETLKQYCQPDNLLPLE